MTSGERLRLSCRGARIMTNTPYKIAVYVRHYFVTDGLRTPLTVTPPHSYGLVELSWGGQEAVGEWSNHVVVVREGSPGLRGEVKRSLMQALRAESLVVHEATAKEKESSN